MDINRIYSTVGKPDQTAGELSSPDFPRGKKYVAMTPTSHFHFSERKMPNALPPTSIQFDKPAIQ
jgi:hypothetical protein